MFHNDLSQPHSISKSLGNVRFPKTQIRVSLTSLERQLSLQISDIILGPFHWKLESCVIVVKVTGLGVHSPCL